MKNNIPKQKDNLKYKNFSFQELEVKSSEDDKYGYISGIANQVGIIDSWYDKTVAGAFDKTVRENPKVLALKNHSWNQIIGVSTLSVKPDGSLYVEMKIDKNVQEAKEIHSLTELFQKEGRPLEFSIGYLVNKSSEIVEDEVKIRLLEEVEVYEVSVVPIGANSESRVTDVKTTSNEAPSNTDKSALDLEKEKTKFKMYKQTRGK